MSGCPSVFNKLPGRLVLVTLLFIVAALLTGCPKNGTKPDGPRVGVSTRPSVATSTTGPVPAGVAFNGERAMDHVRKQVEFGPRPPGSPELARTREYIIDELKKYGLAVSTDEFVVTTPDGEKHMVNVTAELTGELKDVIIIACHYETKQYKDMHFVGANDPAASVGTLIELGRVLTGINQKPKFTYWFVFFDGEEAFCEQWDQCSKQGAPDNTYGSRRYVSQLKDKNELDRVKSLILLDMIGYKRLELGRDTMSTRSLQDVVWQTAKELGYGSVFIDRPEGIGSDDHEPFLRAGIDSVDLIQLGSYPDWHKATDTLDKIAPQSMKIVGEVVIASLPRVEQRILRKTKRLERN
jgi:glutaminyl-peptide cyclotransferase